MLYIKQIMELLGCDKETAHIVRINMVLDFSEATDEQFEREARFIYSRLIREMNI